MADQETKKKRNKRVINEDGDVERDLPNGLSSFKKIYVDYSKPEDDLTLGASSSSDDSSSATEAGVFDFPWLKEGTTDLKFEDAFAWSLDAPNVSEMFEADDALIVIGKFGSREAEQIDAASFSSRNKEEEDENHDDGVECVWDWVLNQQPLSGIEFEAGGF